MEAGEGDLLYLDPPYLPLEGKKQTFTGYHGKFTEQDHLDLARMAQEAKARGAYVLLSNHDSTFARKIYSDAGADLIRPVMINRSIGRGKGKNVASKVPEIIVCWEPSCKADPPASFSLPYLSGKSRARAVVEAVRRGADMPSIQDPEEIFEALKLTDLALERAQGRMKTRALAEIARIAKNEGIKREDLP
jgi:hypothetical protein